MPKASFCYFFNNDMVVLADESCAGGLHVVSATIPA